MTDYEKSILQALEENRRYREIGTPEECQKSVGICKKLLARHKMKRQIQSYESEEKTD